MPQFIATVHILIGAKDSSEASDAISELLTNNAMLDDNSGIKDWSYKKNVEGVYPGPIKIDENQEITLWNLDTLGL